MDKPFVHLHVHSEYSLLDGANRCADLAAAAAEMEMGAVAITDHGVMNGCIEFYSKCHDKGVKPILGCEVYVEPEGHTSRNGRNTYHLILLAENDEGYANLTKLVSIASTDGFYYTPRIDHDLLARYSRGLIGASACLGGEIPQLILKGDLDGAASRAQLYRDILGKDNFFLEIQSNALPEQVIVNKSLADIAKKDGYGLIATNDAHYMKRSDAEWHDVLLCMQMKSKIDDPNRFRFSGDDFYFRSREEMWKIFGSELPESLTNTRMIADRCDVALRMDQYHLPEFPLPEGETLESYLRKSANEGLKRRLKTDTIDPVYAERLNYELEIIERMGFPGYFCIVADIIAAAKERGIPVGPGRGSAAGSVVAWSLGITDLDPIRYNLLFERFLNIERISMPDIDTDVSDKRRDEVISYIVEKYGSDKVAQIITFSRMKTKAAIADVGRVMGLPVEAVRQVTKVIPDGIKSGIRSIPEAIENVPDLRTMYNTNTQVKSLLDVSTNIEGLVRHYSQHAAGIVITPKPIIEMIPIQTVKDVRVTQYEMEPVEKLGLVKMDFLGLRTLSVIEDALKNIVLNGKQPINLEEIPMDDAKTYEMLQRGDTLGVFQLESTGMTALVRRMRPDRFEDLIALVALYRPGPLESGMADQYVRRKHRDETVHYLHPSFRSSMEETYGVILYQEQVMQSASDLAGYTLGEADLLRRAMGKKKVEEMAKQRAKFVEGARNKGVSPGKAGEIFDIIEKFAGYGFNKSHSAAYALISYRTAWLKANYGEEFLAAYLSSMVDKKMEVLGNYIRKVRDAGYDVLLPDINESETDFTVTGEKKIRLGLSAINKVGHLAVENIIATRKEGGGFTSLWDFITRVDTRLVNRGVTDNLIKAGAFDSICENRAQLLANAPPFLDMAGRQAKDANQGSLFSCDDFDIEPAMEPREDFSGREKLECEKESMGLYVSAHPFDQYERVAGCYATCPISELPNWSNDSTPIVACGMLSAVTERFTKKGDPMGILVIEDSYATTEVVLYPKQWSKFKPFLSAGQLCFVKGLVRHDRGTSVLADDIYMEDEFRTKLKPHIVITLYSDGLQRDFYEKMYGLLKANRGKTGVILKLVGDDRVTVSMLKGLGVEAGEKLFSELDNFAQGRLKYDFAS